MNLNFSILPRCIKIVQALSDMRHCVIHIKMDFICLNTASREVCFTHFRESMNFSNKALVHKVVIFPFKVLFWGSNNVQTVKMVPSGTAVNASERDRDVFRETHEFEFLLKKNDSVTLHFLYHGISCLEKFYL